MEYFLRNEKGILIARLSKKLAVEMMSGISGKYVQKIFENMSNPTTCFQFTEDMVCKRGDLELLIWIDDYIEIKEG